MANQTYTWIAVLVAHCSCGVIQAFAAERMGITSVRATQDTITLRGPCGQESLRIVEFAPHQTAQPTNFGAIGSRFLARSNFSVQLPRFDASRDRLFSSFLAVREATDGALIPIGTNRFVEELEGVAEFAVPFPTAASKKGLQVQMVDDALALGIKHVALNVNFSQMLEVPARSNSLAWPVDGRTVHFNRGYLESLDRQIKPMTDAGVVVSLILLAYQSGNASINERLLHPRYDKSAPNRLGAFNTVTADGVLHFRACVEFLARRFSQPETYHGRVANFILGNEVNSHWFWANMGRVPMETFADDYLRTARIAQTALRKITASARLYLSLEHHWNIRYPGGDAMQAFPGHAFLDYFNRRTKEQGDFDWHLAFHPYPENLFEPRTWNDKSATSNDDTPRITFKNLEVLPRYLRRPGMLYRGEPRRIILSEQGFHSADKPEGELWQAAGYAYAWYKVEHHPGIDAFILHRHVDHQQEGGLNLGLWRRKPESVATPSESKKIYQVFKAADTPGWEKVFEFALPVIGIQRWDELEGGGR